jgi:hypothetical protein
MTKIAMSLRGAQRRSNLAASGEEALELLSGDIEQRFPDLPVMLVPAYGGARTARWRTDASEFITKPVDFAG